MKKTSLIAAVSGVLLAVGLLIGAVGFGLGGKNGFYVDMTGVHVYGELPRQQDSRTLPAFDNISLDCGSGDVTLVESDRFAVEYDLDGSYEIRRMEVENGTLYVDVGAKGSLMFFNFDLAWKRPADCVKIYYPSGTRFRTLGVKLTSGSLRGRELTAGDADLRLSSGYLQLDGLTGGTVKIVMTSGNSRLSALKADALSLECASGGIAIEGADVSGRLYVRATSGDIRLADAQAGSMEAKLSSGNLTINGLTADSFAGNVTSGGLFADGVETGGLDFHTSSGNVRLDGTFRGDSKISATSGDISVNSKLPETAYSLAAHATSGDIRVNGHAFAGQVERDTGNAFDISATSGDINVNFSGNAE